MHAVRRFGDKIGSTNTKDAAEGAHLQLLCTAVHMI